LVFAIYWPVVMSSERVLTDDHFLLEPMEQLQSFWSYPDWVSQNKVIDRQPVRDFTLWVDARLSEQFGFKTYHATNVLLWLCILLAVARVAATIGASSPYLVFAIFWLAVHPAAVNSVAWAASRKHLLSALFIVLATLTWLQVVTHFKKRKLAGSLAFYGLAVFSQPINVLWPVWAAFVAYQNRSLSKHSHRRAIVLSIGFLGLAMAGVAIMNMLYYASPEFQEFSGTKKYLIENWNTVWVRVLMLGRYVLQIFTPIAPSIWPYEDRSYYNVIGLVIFLCVMPLLIKALRSRRAQPWVLFGFLPLFTVTAKLTSQIGWDTYLLTPLCGISILLAIALPTVLHKLTEKVGSRQVIISGVGVVITLALLSHTQASGWVSEVAAAERAVEVEETPFNLMFKARQRLNQGLIPEAFEISAQVYSIEKTEPNLGYVLTQAINLLPNLSFSERLALYKKYELKGPWYFYNLAALLARENDFNGANLAMESGWECCKKAMIEHFDGKYALIAAKWTKMCRRARGSNCDSIAQRFKDMVPPKRWDGRIFEGESL
jgi:hypothetical protein